MPSRQVVQILIEAEEQVSKVAKKAEQALDKLGQSGSNAMNRINSIAGRVQNGFSKLQGYVDKAREKFLQFVSSSDKLGTIKSYISNAANSFGELVKNSDLSAKAMEKLKSVSDGIKSKFTDLQSKITGFGSSARNAFSSLSVAGVKEKLSSVGGAIDNLKAKFRSLNTQVGSTSSSFGFLRSAASMTVGMIGYDLVNSFVESGRAALNAQGQLQYFGKRLNMSASETTQFNQTIDNMQKSFRKVNMKAVGASAEEMAVKLKLPKSSLEELTKTTAVMSSAFVKEGRTQEDAILAVSDALDGQFKRLQELGITREDLINQGWNGDLKDTDSLLKAMNKTLDEKGFTQTAQDITSLDDAFQALSVAGGDLLASVLIPLTPVLVGVMSAVIDAMDAFKGFIGILQTGFGGMPDWAQIAFGVTALGIAFGIVGTIIMSTYVPGMVASVISTINWIATALGAEVSAITLSGAFGLLATSIWAALSPLLPFIALAALLAVAIFEIGKSFGWWKDVNTMLAAISAGLQRLWSAFINHPDVQAAIKAIGDALRSVGQWLGWAGQQVLKFFGISSGSKWDAVASLIRGIGAAWAFVKPIVVAAIEIIVNRFQTLWTIIGIAVSVGQAVYEALKPIVCILLGCSPGIVPALQTAYEMFVEVWDAIMGFIGPIIGVIVATFQSLVNVVELFKNGQINLPTLIIMVLSLLWNAYTTILTKIIIFVIQFGTQMLQKARQAGMNFVNGIINYIRQLPGKVYSYLLHVVSRIVSAGAQWVSNAKSKAQELVDGAANTLSSLPSRISSAISGVVDAIVQPFRDAYNQAKQLWDDICNLADSVPGVGGYGGETAYGGDMFSASETKVVIDDSKITIDHNHNLKVDLEHVPAHIDTDTLIRMLTSKEVLEQVVASSEYQTVDKLAKEKMNGRLTRALGG